MDASKMPKGRYRGRAVDGQLGYTSKGNEQIAIEFEFLDEQWAGTRMTWYGYFTEKSQERTVESLRLCGWKGDDITDLDGIGDNEVQLVVDHEEYDGKLQARIAFVNRLGGIGMKSPMSEAQKKAFAAKMRGLAVKSRSATPANGSAKAPAGNDDVPF